MIVFPGNNYLNHDYHNDETHS
ncbi:hypothetical protein SS209_03141 [Salmonella enterica subsp. enterica serovar Senftenberg str. SS209]|nr:hypothetical protein SS209_03141 [Salmonella enterica subsp. enterica serovar Senftenberg str. SS209]